MRIFQKEPKKNKPRQTRSPLTFDEQQDRQEQKLAWNSFVKQAREDPELMKHFMYKRMRIEPPAPKDPSEVKKQQLRTTLVEEACRMVEEDPELRREYAESMLGEVISKSAMKRRSDRGDEEYYDHSASGSSISQALGELDSLLELKTRLTELGETNGGEVSKGFFGGLQLKDLLAILPQIIPYLVSGQKGATQQQEPMYVVQVDGAPTQVTESQYHQLLQEGRIKPMAILAPPQKSEVKPEPKVITEAEEHQQPQSDLPTLDFILERVTFGDLLHCMSGDPDELVMLLYDGKESGSEWAQYVWGMLANSDYESLMAMAQHYSADDRATEFIELLMSDSSREWIENVIDRIKSM